MTFGPQSFTLSTLFEAAKAGQWSTVLNLLYSGWLSIKIQYKGFSLIDIAETQQNESVLEKLRNFYRYIRAADEMDDSCSTSATQTFTPLYPDTLKVPTPFRPQDDQQKYCEFIVKGFPRMREAVSRDLRP
jgi:hypothetical protein